MKQIAAILMMVLLSAPAGATELIEGPIVEVTESKEVIHPLQLLGETRAKRKHWWSLKLGQKYYIYSCAETKNHYITTKKIPLVHDPRPWGKQHPFLTGGFEMAKITAGGLITAGVAAAGARK